MSPKERAEYLVDKYKFYLGNEEENIKEAIDLALIAVDEVIKALDNEDIYIQGETDLDYHVIHWQKVKQEIEKL
jgi:hypothetical protein